MTMKRIGIVDSQTCNLASVTNAFSFLKAETVVIREPQLSDALTHLVLPGVGAFQVAMENLRQRHLDQWVQSWAQTGRPLLGICLGMQLLGSQSEEFGLCDGLGLIPGDVKKIPVSAPLRLPHMGWNSVHWDGAHPLWKGLPDDISFYFVHSYVLCPQRPVARGLCDYGGPLTAAVASDNIMGVQFHPEKSQKAGLELLRNFVERF